MEDAKVKFAAEDKAAQEKAEQAKKAEAEKRAKDDEAYAKMYGMDKIVAMLPNAERIEEQHGYQEYYRVYFKDCVLVLNRLEAAIYDKSKRDVVLNKLPIDSVCYKYLEDFIKVRKSELNKQDLTKEFNSFMNALNEKSR